MSETLAPQEDVLADLSSRSLHLYISTIGRVPERISKVMGISISTLLIWLACHFVGDFAFQSSWMSIEKGKSWEVNFYHAATYTAVFVLFAHSSVVATAVLFITHVIVDPLKARYKIIGPIWLDQLLHFLTIVLILWLKM